MKSTVTFGKTILALLFICLFGVNTSQGQVVISQLYGAGGNAGATYNADFVELYNKGNAAVSFGGTWSIQYASATGTSWTNILNLTGTIPANGYYLIRLATGANGVALPITPDQTGTINMSGSAGKLALCNSTTALTGACPTGGAIQDFVGFGTTANCQETANAPVHTVTTWLTRAAGGCTDSNNNSTDFSATTTAVRNTASTINTCSVVPTVSTSAATGITTTDATFNGTVTAGGATATVVFDYGTSLAYGLNATATQSPLAGNSVGAAVSASVTGLSLNTLYHFRASATNNAGTTNGSDATFYTLAGTPNAPSVGGATASTLSITIAADGNSSGTEYAIRETASGNYVQLNGSLSSTPVWRTASAWGAMVVTGLTASTTYNFDVKARNGDNIETAFSSTGSGTTTSASSPTITLTASLTAFSTTAGVPSSSQSYTVEGTNLTADITIAPPASFEISTDNSTWVTSAGTITLTQSGGTVSPTTIYARLNPATSGTFSGSIQHTSTGAGQQDLILNGTAIAAEPTVQSSITFGATTTSSIVVNFSGGDGASRIVVASLSPVTFVPTDGNVISGVNTNFTTAFDQGSGNKVIYDGSGNTVTVTGLTSSTLYYFAVYEYNGSGSLINYYVTSPGTGVQGSATAEPTISSTTTFTKTTTTTATLTFISGNGANRIVVLKAGSAVGFVPADGTAYTGVNSDFSLATDQGSGDKIVYDGNATTVTVTGLVSGVTYYAAVYEYNSSGLLSNYLTSSFGSASGTTVASISYTTGTYTQNFDGLPSTGTVSFGSFGNGANTLSTPPVSSSTLTGWQVANSTGGVASLVVDNGNGSAGAAYSYGTTASTDRALGSLASNSLTAYYGAVLQNDGSTPLSTISISFTNEQWRSGANASTNHIVFEYSLNGSDILTGTFTGVSALDLNSVIAATASNQVLDGNLPANQAAITYTFTMSGNWLPGQKLVLRWKDFNESGNDDGLAMDNFSFSAVGPQTPLVQESLINFSTVLTNAMTVNWTPGDGTNRIVVMNTTNSFTDPTDGNTYTANSVYSGSGEQVVYDGAGASVNVTGLTPSTTYYFRAYGYNGIGVATKYITTTETDNPNSTSTAAPSFPTNLVVLDVNNGADVIVNQPFTVTVQAQDGAGSPQNVVLNTDVTLTVFIGAGNLTATVTGTMTAGTNTLTISGVVYDLAESFVMLDAAATSGDVLTSAQTNPFSVYDVASNLQFAGVPLNGILNTSVSPFTVYAARPDGSVDPYYTGSATIALFNGPGAVTGTMTKPFVNGVATFDDIQFNTIGVYVLDANSGSLSPAISSNILINPAPAFTELVVPKYFGAKESASANNCRTPIAICFQIDNISPNTTYNLGFGLALTSEASTVLGAGTIYNGVGFTNQVRNGAFTTDANGSSGPVWVYFQPSGNASRFAAGAVHNIRVAYSTGTIGSTPNFVGSKTLTALDITATASSSATTTDDGGFVTGSFSACVGGKVILLYDDVSGSGDPLYAYQASPLAIGQSTQTLLPTSVDQIYQNLATAGKFAGVVPIGANAPNGVRRIEARNTDNTVAIAQTSATGIWPSGANTTTITRNAVVAITNGDANLSTVSVSASSTNATCFGTATGTLSSSASSTFGSITYEWSPGGATTADVSGVAANTYTVTVTDGNGCTASATTTITEPTDLAIVGQVTNTACSGGNTGAIDITVSGGTPSYSYAWDNSSTSEDLSSLGAGTYVVTVTDANGCTKTESFTVVAQSSGSSLTATATPSSICAGESSTLDASGATTYTWSPAGSLNTNTGAQVIATPSVSTTYTVNALDGFGCQSIATVSVTVNPLPTVVVSPASSTICGGASVALTASGADSYSWSPATDLSATTGAAVTSTPSATITYTVTGTTAAGCTSTTTSTITVNSVDAPTAVTPVTYCQGETATALSATPLAGNSLWWYTTPTGGNASATAPTPSTATAGTTTYYVSQQESAPLSIAINGYLDNGAPDEYTFVALSKIPAGTVIYFTDNGWVTGTGFRGASATDANGAEGFVRWTAINTVAAGTVIRSAVSTADYTWTTSGAISCSTCTGTNNYTPLDFAGAGDQIYAFTSSVTDNPLFNTASQTHLYVFDDTNGFETATTTAQGAIPPGLTSGVTANTFAFASSNYVNLSNDGQTRTIAGWRTYIATAAKYTTGTGVNPGLPSTALNVDLGCESPRTAITVVVNPAPIVTATPSSILCNGGTSSVVVSATNGTAPYLGTGTFTELAGSHTYTVTDNIGCSGSTTINITEPTVLSASATQGAAILCYGGTTSVTVTATGGTSPYTGEGVFTVGAGTYNYSITDANGCTTSASAIVTEPTELVASSSAGTIACPGGSTTVVVSATGGTGAYTGTGSFTVTAGTYNYTVTDENGCTSSTSTTVSDPAAVGFSGFLPAFGCPGSSVTINGTNLNLVTAIDFNGTSAIFVLINSTEIQATVPAGASTGVINLTTAGSCVTSSSSSFTVTSCTSGMTLNLTVYIQGYYIGGGTMTPVLANQAVAGATGLEVDTIIIELHDVNSFALMDQASAVLMVDGTCSATFSVAGDGDYYIAVRHRNSIYTWSAVPVTFSSSTPASFDFSTSDTQAMSGWMANDLLDGVYAIFNGDINQDEFVDPNDYPYYDIANSAGSCCDYIIEDLNGDGFVDPNDYPIFDINNSAGVFSIHP